MTKEIKIYLIINLLCYIFIITNLLVTRNNLYFKIIDILELSTYIPDNQSINMVPFKSIFSIYLESEYIFSIGLPNIFINLFLLTPLIIVILFFIPSLNFLYTILIGTLLSVSIESLQLFLNSGHFDIDDIILNVISSIIAYLIYSKLKKEHVYLSLGIVNLVLVFTLLNIFYPNILIISLLIVFLFYNFFCKIIYQKIYFIQNLIFFTILFISNICFNFFFKG